MGFFKELYASSSDEDITSAFHSWEASSMPPMTFWEGVNTVATMNLGSETLFKKIVQGSRVKNMGQYQAYEEIFIGMYNTIREKYSRIRFETLFKNGKFSHLNSAEFNVEALLHPAHLSISIERHDQKRIGDVVVNALNIAVVTQQYSRILLKKSDQSAYFGNFMKYVGSEIRDVSALCQIMIIGERMQIFVPKYLAINSFSLSIISGGKELLGISSSYRNYSSVLFSIVRLLEKKDNT